jgi:hypothetical protein
VAALLHNTGHREAVVTAGILHDTIEDTPTSLAEIHERFGTEVAELVDALTEDPAIEGFDERKAALRRQISEFGPDATSVYAADKVTKVRELIVSLGTTDAVIDPPHTPSACRSPSDSSSRGRESDRNSARTLSPDAWPRPNRQTARAGSRPRTRQPRLVRMGRVKPPPRRRPRRRLGIRGLPVWTRVLIGAGVAAGLVGAYVAVGRRQRNQRSGPPTPVQRNRRHRHRLLCRRPAVR